MNTMYSQNPDPANDLALLLEQKRTQPDASCKIVGQCSSWLKSELKGVKTDFTYLSCDDAHHYGYSMFLIHQTTDTQQITLSIKIAEVNECPHAYCEIRVNGGSSYNSFPLFTELDTDDGKKRLLAYIADFILSAEL